MRPGGRRNASGVPVLLMVGTKDFVNFSTRQYTNPDDVGEMSSPGVEQFVTLKRTILYRLE